MIRVGIVGIGFMGWIHWLAYQRLEDARVAAISTRNQQKLRGDWRDIQGNFGPPGEQVDLSAVTAYERLEDLLADPQIDLVDVALPTSLHAEVAIRALEAGKHVLCEKPMALNLEDCQRMVAAAERAGRLLMIGHVLPYFPEYQWARATIESGKFGRVLGASFRRIIANPAWAKDFWSPQHIGGPMLDLHIHDAHFIRLLFGMPVEVAARGRMRNDLPAFWYTHFKFPSDDLAVEATCGTIDQQGRPFTHGFEIHLQGATLMFDFAVIDGSPGYLCRPTLLAGNGAVEYPTFSSDDPISAFENELSEVVRCIAAGENSLILGAELAQDAMRICAAEAESLRQGGAYTPT